MRCLALLGLLTACTATDVEVAIPGNGPVRRGVFIENGGELAVISAAGDVVRENGQDGLSLLGPDLMARRTVDLGYRLERERSVQALALAADRTIAVVTRELDYESNDEELVVRRLVLVAPAGNVAWTKVLADEPSDAQVAISSDQVFLVEYNRELSAYSRATGSFAWKQPIGSSSWSQDVSISVDDRGGIAVAGPSVDGIVAYASDGTMRWSSTADALGMTRVDRIAYSDDGSLGVVGRLGDLDSAVQRVGLVDPMGRLAWSRELGNPYQPVVTSLATDGARVVAAGYFAGHLSFDPSTYHANDTDGFVVSIVGGEVESVRTIGGVGTQNADIIALSGPEGGLVRARNFDDPSGPEIQVGGMSIAGLGMAIVDFERL